MWFRAGLGGLLCLIGVVWMLQGLDIAEGSGMSGHGIWALLGVGLLAVGIALLRAAAAAGRRR
jgi:hypothetical protein